MLKNNNIKGGEITKVGVCVNLTDVDRKIIALLGCLLIIYFLKIGQILPAVATLIIILFWVAK